MKKQEAEMTVGIAKANKIKISKWRIPSGEYVVGNSYTVVKNFDFVNFIFFNNISNEDLLLAIMQAYNKRRGIK